MTLPSLATLRELPRAELIEISAQLLDRIRELEAEVAALKPKPRTTSQNSSQPPSRDQKGAQPPTTKRKRKPGAQAGHAKSTRTLVEQPDVTVVIPVANCQQCGLDLAGASPESVIRRQVTELPVLKPVVIETQQHAVCCPNCQTRQTGALPAGLEAGRTFGPRLEALVTYLHQVQHVSYTRLLEILETVFGIALSAGGAVAIVERAGEAAAPEATAIGQAVAQDAVIQSDETSCRVKGRNYWEWVFIGKAGTYHLIQASRAAGVVAHFMGDQQAKVWLSDCWQPQLSAPAAQHQLCIPHQIRALQGLRDRRPRLRWAHEMQALLRAAIHLNHRREALTDLGFRRQVTRLKRRLDRLLNRSFTGEGVNLLNRYRTHRESLFVFLDRRDVPADNNACERALRPSVIHRKVLGCFRSEWGAHAYAALATVLNTAKQQGLNAFEKLTALMGKPVLPYLQPSTP